ncbi:MAG: hypothetical protein HZA95_01450 [Candidatus Vogelbacteria bacterium]|nr:hypothetical protein [Candidatus Vogelbacteria bacterium]
MVCSKCNTPRVNGELKCSRCDESFAAQSILGSPALQRLIAAGAIGTQISLSQRAAEGVTSVIRRAFGDQYPRKLFESELGRAIEPALACAVALLLCEKVNVPQSDRVSRVAELGFTGATKDLTDIFMGKAGEIMAGISELGIDVASDATGKPTLKEVPRDPVAAAG